MSTPVANLVERFHAKRSGNGWLAHCPAHQDKTPSLSIAEGSDGRALLKCFAGCENTAILSALGMSFVDLFPVPAPAPVKSAATETPKAAVTPRPLGEILDALQSILRRYVVFQSQEQVAVIATWIFHTWTLEAFDYTPYLNVFAASKRSGKSRALEVLSLLCRNPQLASGGSSAALTRSIDEENPPTILLDEVDAIYSKKGDPEGENKRQFLNAGYRRGAKFLKCIGQGADITVKEFSAFAPKRSPVLEDAYPTPC